MCILKDKLVHLWDVPSFLETYMLSVRWRLNLKYICSHTYCYSRHLHIDTRKCKNTQWQAFWQVTDSYFNAIKHRMRLRGISGSSQWRCGSQSYVQASSFLGHSHKIRECWILILLFLVAEVKHSFWVKEWNRVNRHRSGGPLWIRDAIYKLQSVLQSRN